ncbi:hypothetical protein D3C87_1235650 [compost metagenome]
MVIEPLIGRLQAFIKGRAAQLTHQIVHRLGGQRMGFARKHKGALGQHRTQLLAQHHLIGLVIPRRQRLFGGEESPAQLGQQGQGRDLGAVLFLKLWQVVSSHRTELHGYGL